METGTCMVLRLLGSLAPDHRLTDVVIKRHCTFGLRESKSNTQLLYKSFLETISSKPYRAPLTGSLLKRFLPRFLPKPLSSPSRSNHFLN